MVKLECENLRKEFGNGTIVAVDSVDITIEDGTFVTILGPSGCGKTTLLRMLAGLERPTSGSIYFDGQDVTDDKVQDRHIGMVFQNIALFPFKTVRQNIEYGLKYTDTDKTTRQKEAVEMAEMLGIDELMDNKPNQLSGGQRQRVALGRALIRDPNVFLLDEPMAALDAELKVALRTELKELHQEFQTTTLYVTHDQEEAMTLSEEVIVIDEGRVQQQSPPFEMFSRPNNMFVARFIGSPNINFFDATFRDGELVVDELTRPIPVPDGLSEDVMSQMRDRDLTIGVRPSEMSMVDATDDPLLHSEAQLYEQLGDETILHTTIDGTKDVRALIPPTVTPDVGEAIHLDFEPSGVHVFDARTEEAIVNGLGGKPGSASATDAEESLS